MLYYNYELSKCFEASPNHTSDISDGDNLQALSFLYGKNEKLEQKRAPGS